MIHFQEKTNFHFPVSDLSPGNNFTQLETNSRWVAWTCTNVWQIYMLCEKCFWSCLNGLWKVFFQFGMTSLLLFCGITQKLQYRRHTPNQGAHNSWRWEPRRIHYIFLLTNERNKQLTELFAPKSVFLQLINDQIEWRIKDSGFVGRL